MPLRRHPGAALARRFTLAWRALAPFVAVSALHAAPSQPTASGAGSDGPRCEAWMQQLGAPTADQRERAARALLERCERSRIGADSAAAARLRAMVDLRDASAAALLLLGDRPDEASRAALRAAAGSGLMVKLDPWLAPVPAALAAAVALARIGTDEDRAALAVAATQPALGERIFLLHVIGDVHAPSALRAMFGYLHDTREIGQGLPAGASPRRRLCDLALDALVRRLHLQPPFTLRLAGRYTATEIDGVEHAALAALR